MQLIPTITFDIEYLRGSIATVHSILRNSSYPENVFFHFLVSDTDLDTIIRYMFPQFTFEMYYFDPIKVQRMISNSVMKALDQPLNYVRNYLPDLLEPSMHRVIYLYSDLIGVDDIFLLCKTDWSTGSSSSNEPYPLVYHSEDDIFSFKELSDGSIQSAYAYHYDMTNIGRYFVEFEDGSILSTKNREPYVPLKPTDEYFRLEENPVNTEFFIWNENFPALKVGAGENAENNNVGQVFDTSPQRATRTSQETEPKHSGKREKKGFEVSEELVNRIRGELSCAICLEICFQPSTTSCGHSFCGECLRAAADICGTRCPECRQLISNGSSCTVNTGLWNTIQLLFPKEVEARKAAGALNGGEAEHQSSENFSTRRELPSQDDDAALAWRLQREEFM